MNGHNQADGHSWPARISAAIVLVLVFGVVQATVGEPLPWPSYPANSGLFRVDGAQGRNDGLTNAVPDVIGPIDGSAKLTIFTEGNHYPVLLPIALNEFPAHCQRSKRCNMASGEILIVTLPQVMIIRGLERRGFRFGNALLPVSPDGPVFPDIVILGRGPMERLDATGMLASPARVLAKHQGMGLLIDRTLAEKIANLDDFVASDLPFVMATPLERGARQQYIDTLESLLGDAGADALLSREIADFPGRLAIQHRDVPYAVTAGIAPVGIVFGHLARFYAERWPEKLAFVEVPEAARFGAEIGVAATNRAGADTALVEAFIDFLFERAPKAYTDGGFASPESFSFGQTVHGQSQNQAYWVRAIGSREEMFTTGDLSAAYKLAKLPLEQLDVAVGPVEGLKGEITVYAGEVFVSRVTETGQKVASDRNLGGPFLAYGGAHSWRRVEIGTRIESLAELEEWLGDSLGKLGLDSEQSFPFRIEGYADELTYHVLNRRGEGQHSKTSHRNAKILFQGDDKKVRIAGVWAARNQIGVFTHPGKRTHLHVIVGDGEGAGHIDAIVLEAGFTLFVPETETE